MQLFLKILSGKENSVDPDQSDLGLHSLHMSFCQRHWCSKFKDIYRKLTHVLACLDSILFLISSPEHEVLMVSYCGQSMSIVRRPSCVVRHAASTIALKAYSSYTPGPMDSILGRKHQGDL